MRLPTPSGRLPRNRYFLLVFLISGVLLSVFATAVYQQSNRLEASNSAVMQSFEALRRARLVLIHSLDMETGQRGYLLTATEKYLEPYHGAAARMDGEIKQLKALAQEDVAKLAKLDELEAHAQYFKELLAEQIGRLNRQGGGAFPR